MRICEDVWLCETPNSDFTDGELPRTTLKTIPGAIELACEKTAPVVVWADRLGLRSKIMQTKSGWTKFFKKQ
jgi:hypothetical protein